MPQPSSTPVIPSDRARNVLEERIKDFYFEDHQLALQRRSKVYKVPNSAKDGYSEIFRNEMNRGKAEIQAYIAPELDNYYTIFEIIAQMWPNKPLFGTRKYHRETGEYDPFYTFETVSEVRERKNRLGAGIIAAVTGHADYRRYVEPNEPNFELYNNNKPYKFIVLMFSGNRAEWMLTDLACQLYNLVNTALYETLGPDLTAYILDTTKLPIVLCVREKILQLCQLKRQKELTSLVVIVLMDPLLDQDRHLFQMCLEASISLYDMESIERLGTEMPVDLSPVGRDDVYTISFTSGTTGMPKGVVIPQKMFLASLTFVTEFGGRIKRAGPFSGPGLKYLCFLPLTHIYERQNVAFSMIIGAQIGFPKTSVAVASLFEDLRLLKPSFFISVPRVYTKIEALIKEYIERLDIARNSLARSAILQRIEKQSLRDEEKDPQTLYDSLVMKKIRHHIGFDNIEYITTGSAPISSETLKFLKASLGVGVSQGYGLTETLAGMDVSYPYECDPGSSGVVGSTTEVRLRDLPSMNYVSGDKDGIQKGELMVRGPQVFKYYFKREEETKKAFDEDGFFHTGDIAKIDAKGRVYIIDRVKNFFKLAQGEYITPERIENIYLSSCPLLTQMFVYGDSFKLYLVAIVGFEPSLLRHFLAKHYGDLPKDVAKGLKGATTDGLDPNETRMFDYINSNRAVKRLLVVKLNLMVNGSKKLLQGFERIHNFKADVMPLKLEEDTVTPTFKLKRAIATKRFKKEVQELYEEGSLIKEKL